MKLFQCNKCQSKEIFIDKSGNNTGLYCADCGKWITWLNKDDLRLAQRQINDQYVPKSYTRKIGEEIQRHITAIDGCIGDNDPYIANELMAIQNECEKLGVTYY